MVKRNDNRITRTSGMTTWRAGCGGSRTSGSEGGPEKPTSRKADRALRSDPYTSADETSTEVQAVFTRALRDEGIEDRIEAANPDGVAWDPDSDDIPVLLAMSDNGPQMSSGSTREFLALCWIATHYGRPGTPTDQAWIESLFGHLKIEQPHLELIEDIDVLRAELAIQRDHYNTVRLHAGIGYVTPDQEHRGEGDTIRAARRAGLTRARTARITYHRNNRTRGPADAD